MLTAAMCAARLCLSLLRSKDMLRRAAPKKLLKMQSKVRSAARQSYAETAAKQSYAKMSCAARLC